MKIPATMFCPSAPRDTLAERNATSAPDSTDNAVSSRGRASTAIPSRIQNSRLCPTPFCVTKVQITPAGIRTKMENSKFSKYMAVTRLAISRVMGTGILSSRSLSFPPNTTPFTAKVVNSSPPTSAPMPMNINTSTSIFAGANAFINI